MGNGEFKKRRISLMLDLWILVDVELDNRRNQAFGFHDDRLNDMISAFNMDGVAT